MALFELVIALLLAGALLAILARRIGVPYPALLALAGAIAAIVPGTPVVMLDPELALALFVAPTLLDAAFDASPRDMRDNWLPIGALAIIVVGITVAAVAMVAHAIVPAMSWPACIALGAIVAPPDASAAIAVLRQLNPPHRVLVILEGESLFNDATALLIYRLAVAAAAGGSVGGWELIPVLALTVGGAVVLGWLAARLWLRLPLDQGDIPVFVLIQFLGTFAIWILAQRLGVSAIITVVVYAITLARWAPKRSHARARIASYAVWEVVVFVLNVLAFVLIGLQLKAIFGRLDGGWAVYVGTAAAICLVVILVRIAWVMPYNVALRWKLGRFGDGGGRRLARPTFGSGVVISWCGMRGIVTLATALALPADFGHRDLIVFCAFWVVLGTLALQGLTLRPLMQRLLLPVDNSVAEEIRLARSTTARAAIDALQERGDTNSVALLRREYAARVSGGAELPSDAERLPGLQRHLVSIQRRVLFRLRRDGTIGDDAFHAIEEELDILDLAADPRIRTLDGPD
ncbi:MAG TPA: sodium:proton antiporter [Acetobacteraceae bacterium]|nr:sodium:proton antiporter [Acetobacteraceae bacterium]